MTFVDMSLDDAKELEVAPEGDYDLIVDSAEEHTSDKGNKSIHCRILFDGHPEIAPIHHYLGLPASGDDPDKRAAKLRFVKRFLVLFDIAHEGNGFDIADIPGSSSRAHVVQEEGQEPGVMQNKLRLPRFDAS